MSITRGVLSVNDISGWGQAVCLAACVRFSGIWVSPLWSNVSDNVPIPAKGVRVVSGLRIVDSTEGLVEV